MGDGVAVGTMYRAPTAEWNEKSLGCGTGNAVFEKCDQLIGITGGRKAGLTRTDDGQGFARRKMREGFFEGASEVELGSLGSDAQDGFSEAEDAVGGGFKGLGGGIVRIAGDDDLERVMREERGGKAVGGGE